MSPVGPQRLSGIPKCMKDCYVENKTSYLAASVQMCRYRLGRVADWCMPCSGGMSHCIIAFLNHAHPPYPLQGSPYAFSRLCYRLIRSCFAWLLESRDGIFHIIRAMASSDAISNPRHSLLCPRHSLSNARVANAD